MTRMVGPDCVVMCNLIHIHTHTHKGATRKQGGEHKVLRARVQFNTYTHTHTCSSMELIDYRAGLRGYVQFNK